MKKLCSVVLCLALLAAILAGCAGKSDPGSTHATGDKPAVSDIKIGAVLVGDENEGYTLAHILGIREACKNLGLSDTDNVVWKYAIGEDETCKTAIEDCIDQGCGIVFTNSYGHQDYAKMAAEQNPDIQIVAMTGDTAKASGLANFHNAFTEIYEARYAAGVVAGLKIAELAEEGKLTGKNYSGGKVRVGYVGAYPYAEVISGFTAFYLGIKSVYEDVVMDVLYTSSWFDITAEKAAAEQLIGNGCVIIGQHADSTGAPSACEAALNAGTTVYSVGYNIDMLTAAPNAALVSPTNEWGVYYTYAIDAFMKNGEIAQNWAEGFDKNAVALTKLGPNVAAGTEEKVSEVIAGLKDGSIHPFDISTFTVGGKELSSCFATDSDGDWVPDKDEAVFDGFYHESYFQSAPAFATIIDGITPLN